MTLIGRTKEKEIIQQVKEQDKPDLVAIYGRRRVGKTHLVREMFSFDKGSIYTEVTGRKGANTTTQLSLFFEACSRSLHLPDTVPIPQNWKTAFETYTRCVEEAPEVRHYLFLDELPWLASPRSGCLEQIDHFWNTRWSRLSNLKVILCGSAAGWMLNKLIYNKGGLHNRLTRILQLEPFSLSECRSFLRNHGVDYSEREVIEVFLCTGGIPYYLDWIQKNHSPVQSIQALGFEANGVLYKEYDSLMQSLFDNHEIHLAVVNALAMRHYGASRKELLKLGDLKDGGPVSRALSELTAAGFIGKFSQFGNARDLYFQIVDPFIRFHKRWIQPARNLAAIPENYWLTRSQTGEFASWAGHTFEVICLRHIDKILKALGITGMHVSPSTWRYIPPKKSSLQGAQIDIVLDRADKTITLCEVKFKREPLSYNQTLKQQLLTKAAVFREVTGTKRRTNSAVINFGGFLDPTKVDADLVGMITGEQLFD